jgi:hypothetical protein
MAASRAMEVARVEPTASPMPVPVSYVSPTPSALPRHPGGPGRWPRA